MNDHPTLQLWRHLFADERGYLSLLAGKRIGDRLDKPQVMHVAYPQAAGMALDWLQAQADSGAETYFCAHLLTDKRRVKANAAPIRALWCDGDGAQIPDDLPAPTAIVRSSPGREHFYWRLSEAIAPEEAESLNRRIAYGVSADLSGWDLTQVLRPPGMPNFKYRDRPLVDLVVLDERRVYDPMVLATSLPAAPARSAPPAISSGDEPPIRLGPNGLAVWRGEQVPHKTDGSVDRSAALVKVARVLERAGATEPTLLRALAERDATLGWNKYTDRPDAEQQYAAIVALLQREPTVHRNGTSAGPTTFAPEPRAPPEDRPRPKRLCDLQAAGLPELSYVASQILPEGVTLCAGRPKQGKSFLVLNIAIAVASGAPALGDLPVMQGSVLYLSLEGGEHGLLPRVNTMLRGVRAPADLEYETKWPRLDKGGGEAIGEWIQQRRNARLIIVDTMQRIRPPTNGKQSVYEQDDAALQPLIDLAKQCHVAILVVHHTRKSAADDVLDTVSGSTGLTGSVDAVWVLQRVRGQETAVLTVAGRNIPDLDLGLKWDAEYLTWNHDGTGEDARRSTERRLILEAMERDGGGPLTVQEIADLIDATDYNSVRKMLWRMERSGELRKESKGYVIPL